MDSLFIDEKKGEKKEEEIKENKDEKIWDKIKKFFKDVLSLVKNVIFILSLLKRSIVFFSLQIVQSYLKQYQQHNFENADEDLIVLFYSIATLASTALGGLMSGIITKKLGGYENKKSIYVIIIPEIITGITVAFLTFTCKFDYLFLLYIHGHSRSSRLFNSKNTKIHQRYRSRS